MAQFTGTAAEERRGGGKQVGRRVVGREDPPIQTRIAKHNQATTK